MDVIPCQFMEKPADISIIPTDGKKTRGCRGLPHAASLSVFFYIRLSLSCGDMKKIKTTAKHSGRVARQQDLVEMVLEPLSSQVDQVGLQILEKIQKLLDSTDIMARQMARQAKRGE